MRHRSRSLSFRSLAAIGRMRTIGAARLASLGSNSLPAVRAFLQGAQFFRRTQWDSAAAALKEAVAIDSTFGIAYAMLGEAYGWTGESGSEAQWLAFRRAGELIRAGLSPHDSLTLVAVKHFANGNRRGPDRATEMHAAYAAARAVTERYPDDAPAWYLYGDMRYHNDKTLTEREALANFDHAIRADSDFVPAYIHAIELAYRNGPAAGNRYVSAYLSRTQPGAGVQREAMAMAMRLANGNYTADGLRKLLDTVNLNQVGNANSSLRRLTDSAEVLLTVVRAAASRIPPSQAANFGRGFTEALAFRGHIAEAWARAVQEPSMAAAEIALLGLVPPDSAVRVMTPWLKREDDASFYLLPALGVARDTITLNRLRSSIEARLKTDTIARNRLGMTYFIAAAHAYTVLARGDSSAATPLFDAFTDSTFDFPTEQFVRARLVARKDPARALVLLEQMTSVGDLLSVARQLERGRIAERLGERERAVDAYAYVAAAWRNTESPALRTAVDESKAALTRLDADGRMRAALLSPR